jgi:3-dehydroquinate dehydratase-2
MKIAVLNGPNLTRLGLREPEVYGARTLADLEAFVRAAAPAGVDLEFFQSNHEGELIDTLHRLADRKFGGIVINPGAYTHTSIALHDALKAIAIPAIEVHISNVHARESFRHTSLTAPACVGAIAGLGFEGYAAAVRFLSAPKAG